MWRNLNHNYARFHKGDDPNKGRLFKEMPVDIFFEVSVVLNEGGESRTYCGYNYTDRFTFDSARRARTVSDFKTIAGVLNFPNWSALIPFIMR